MIILGYFALIVNVMSLCLVDYLRPLVGGVSKTVFQVLGRSRSGSVCLAVCVCVIVGVYVWVFVCVTVCMCVVELYQYHFLQIMLIPHIADY